MKACIGVHGQNHVASTVESPIVGIGRHIIEKGGHSVLGGFAGSSLLDANGIDCNKEFIVNRTTIE
eukprot:5398280-Ditylum_brightwellii.AAC.1